MVDWASWSGTTRVTGRSRSWGRSSAGWARARGLTGRTSAIQRELDRQKVVYVMDGDDMLVDPKVERMVDMIVESITET